MASWVGRKSIQDNYMTTKSHIEELVRVIHSTPIIDNHAHPLLKPDAMARHPLMTMHTEAGGDAMHAAPTTLAHLRAVRQLSEVLGCAATWEAVVAAIEQQRLTSPDEWTARCLAGIETVLVDDGLDSADEGQAYSWHDDYTRSPCRRIVRIEALAADIIDSHASNWSEAQKADEVFDGMLDSFDTAVLRSIADPAVVAFKSVICYRTGLAIPKLVDIAAARASFEDILRGYRVLGKFRRLQHRGLNELFVHRTALLVRENSAGAGWKKPIQFHTGLGDNDITLTKASPSHLQDFIRAYPQVPIVLLHASYPFTREAGYLATVYANVYADIGEVFPFVSREGQEKVLRHIFELCPWSKVLWSTDGHWFPETYLLAVVQMREALQTVLCDYVRAGDIGYQAAIQLTKDILFNNSNNLYRLGLQFAEFGLDDGVEMDDQGTALNTFRMFVHHGQTPSFIRINWIDYTSTPRMRMVPYNRFLSLLQQGKSTHVGITKASLGILQNDQLVPGVSATGMYQLHPDFSSLRPGPDPQHLSMYGEFRDEDGSPVDLCPRTLLRRTVEAAAVDEGLTFLLGFELEFVLLERAPPSPSSKQRYTTLRNDAHAWSRTQSHACPRVAAVLEAVAADLAAASIPLEQVHAESGPGQFELVLPPLPPLEACDALLHARELVAHHATAAGLKSTLHPKPWASRAGTASHVHVSLPRGRGGSDGAEVPRATHEAFYAGVLRRLRGLSALCYASPASYERAVDGAWAGGRWVAWGSQNREAALRRVDGSHWEVRTLDGLANPYLALAGVLGAGAAGVRAREPLRLGDCEADPATLSDNDRLELGIAERLPADLGEALRALREDGELGALLGEGVVERYVAVKTAELELLMGMEAEERREWILERY